MAGLDPNSFAPLWADYLSAKVKRESAAGAERQRLARIEKSGVNMRALRIVSQLRTMEPKEARAVLEQVREIASVLDLEFVRQGDLFASKSLQAPSTDAKATISKAEAYEEGYKAGKGGRDAADNRFPQGSPLHAEFYAGWTDGQRAIAAEMGVDYDETGPKLTPPRRGRPKKDADKVETRTASPRGRRRGAAAGATVN